MKHELENIKPQQYPGQNVADMLLDMTYHCQALTTDGIWDHQLCLSILSTFLLADGDELYHHSLITMKVTLHDRIPSTTPGAEPPRDARDSGSARSHSTHLETSSSNRP